MKHLGFTLDPNTNKSLVSDSFWDYLDQMVASCSIIIDRPFKSPHPDYPETVYPRDYGYLDGTTSIDGGGVDVWLGVSGSHDVSAIIMTVDLHKRDAEIKMLLGCDDAEMQLILDFQNGRSMRALLI